MPYCKLHVFSTSWIEVEKQGAITNCMDWENEVSKMFIISLSSGTLQWYVMYRRGIQVLMQWLVSYGGQEGVMFVVLAGQASSFYCNAA